VTAGTRRPPPRHARGRGARRQGGPAGPRYSDAIIDMLAIRCSDAIIDMLASRCRVRARALSDPAVALLRSLAADVDAAPGLTARPVSARRPAGAWPHAAAAAAVAAVLATVAAVAAASLMLVGMLGRLVWGRTPRS
jgi:hypothetical protein